MAEPFTVLIMAAGRGTRMRSDIPKVLHRVCGKPMLEWVVDAGRDGRRAPQSSAWSAPATAWPRGFPTASSWPSRREGEGTGAAVLAARAQLEAATAPVVILSGDHPLVSAEHLSGLARRPTAPMAPRPRSSPPTSSTRPATGGSSATATARWSGSWRPRTPSGVPAEELAIREINLGTYAFDAGALVSTRSTRWRPRTASAT